MVTACRHLGYDVVMGTKALQVTPIGSALADVIKQHQKTAGYTLRELSRISGVPIARLSRCTRTERPFLLGDVEKIAIAFNMPVSELVNKAEESLDFVPQRGVETINATQSDYELVAKPLSPDTAAIVEYLDNLGEEPQ